MSSNLYVGNLPFEATEEDLNEIFAKHGEVVSAKIVMDRETGRPRGFGFVEMAQSEEAENAIRELNGKDFMGRNLTVNLARPRESRPPRPGGSSGGRPRGGRY